jgi:hypothetical protein
VNIVVLSESSCLLPPAQRDAGPELRDALGVGGPFPGKRRVSISHGSPFHLLLPLYRAGGPDLGQS